MPSEASSSSAPCPNHNARDAMPNGGRLTVETANEKLDEEYTRTRQEVEPGAYVMIAVSDSGHGIDGDTLGSVFDPFFTTKEKGLGTGLGLSTVFGIVKQHGGHISAYSEVGRGTTFKVYLRSVDEEAERSFHGPSAEPRPVGKETVLVVEDEDVVCDLACEALEMLGYSTLSASDPSEALGIGAQYAGVIHLLLTDVVLPRMDGKTLFEKLSKIRPTMKVLYISGYTENFIVNHGVLDRGVHFMHKPFSVAGLAAKVRETLDE